MVWRAPFQKDVSLWCGLCAAHDRPATRGQFFLFLSTLLRDHSLGRREEVEGKNAMRVWFHDQMHDITL